MDLNQLTFCRLCLCTSTSLLDIFDEINVEGLIVKETIEDLLQLKIVRVHGCPWLTCDSCREKLNDFRRFKINCIESMAAFANRFPQQIVVMPGGVSIEKPQTLLLLPVHSMHEFAKSTSNLQMASITSTTQDSSPNCNQFVSGVGGGFLIPCSRNESMGMHPLPNDSQANGIINSGTNFQMVSLANLSTPQGNQLILPESNFLAPLLSDAKMKTLRPEAVSQMVDSARSASDCIVSPPFNSGSECISSSNVTPCPESVQIQSDGMSVVDNDGMLVPKEEVMEQKPEILDLGCGEGRSTLDDHLTCSPFLEAEIEEKEEKKSDGVSVADNYSTLVPKEEVMEQKPEVMDLGCGDERSTLDDHLTCSPFLEAEIEEIDEKKANTKNSPKRNYKWCFVPNCISTSLRTPEKIFVSVPKTPVIRNKWFKAARRIPPKSSQSTLFCCEDHFKMTEDFENVMRYKLMGGNVKLRAKVGTIPRLFDCQIDRKRAWKLQPKPSIEKRQRKMLIKDLIS